MDGFLSMLSALNILHVLSDQELRILMPSRIPQSLTTPQSYLPERAVFVGRRLNLNGVTARCVASILSGVTLGLLAEFPDFSEVIWTLGVRLMRQVSIIGMHFFSPPSCTDAVAYIPVLASS